MKKKVKKLITKAKTFIKSINVSGISIGTWVRTVMLVLSVSVYVAKLFGITIPLVDENTVSQVIVAVIGVVAFLQAYWKNNSITKSAQEADEIMKQKKA